MLVPSRRVIVAEKVPGLVSNFDRLIHGRRSPIFTCGDLSKIQDPRRRLITRPTKLHDELLGERTRGEYASKSNGGA